MEKEDFTRWLHEHYPASAAASEGASWVFEMRFTHPRDTVQCTGDGFIYEVTASGGYEDCISMLAAELADLTEEPFVRLVIRISRGRRRLRISRRGYSPRG